MDITIHFDEYENVETVTIDGQASDMGENVWDFIHGLDVIGADFTITNHYI